MLGGLVTALLVLVTTVSPVDARLGGAGGNCPPGQNDCSVWDSTGSTGGGGGGGNGSGGGSGGAGASSCYRNGTRVPCYDTLLGWFNSSDGCYYKILEPQPDNTPSGQNYYLRSCPNGQQDPVLLASPPSGFGSPPDPVDLAWNALAKITLAAPPIAVAPRKSIGPGLVGLPVWFWANTDQRYWRQAASDSDPRGLSVQITATVTTIVWHLGDDRTITCKGPGIAYNPTVHRGRAPRLSAGECGVPGGYRRAGTYQVYATTHWTVHWVSSSGAAGNLPEQTRNTGTVPIQIRELQVVTE